MASAQHSAAPSALGYQSQTSYCLFELLRTRLAVHSVFEAARRDPRGAEAGSAYLSNLISVRTWLRHLLGTFAT